MTKKETFETQKEDGENIVNEENMNEADKGDVKPEAGENEEKTVTAQTEEKISHAEGKRKKISKEKELESKLKEQHDKYLRLSAEFDNYRKRMLKERMELTQYAAADILTKILPVLDDFERAIVSMKSTEDIAAVKQGIELIYNKFQDYINQQGIKEITALNQDFNTDFHDAVTKIPVQENERKGKVVDVIVKGYTLNDKVIRYSRVVVGE